MMSDFPIPLTQLVAFEAAARHLNFSAAASDLNVQQPAVSRHIKALEDSLGTKLFLRTRPLLTLTDYGNSLAKCVDKGFHELRVGIDQIVNRQHPSPLIIDAGIGFTSFYLLPRMADFQSHYPDISVQISTRDQNPDFISQRSDLVIVFDQAGISGLPSQKVFSGQMVAICHPNLLHQGQMLSPGELATKDLLHLIGSGHEDDWNIFFSETDVTAPRPIISNSYISFMVYLKAIQNGMGFGIGWKPLIDEFLANGSLAVATPMVVETKRSYFCSLTARGQTKAEAHHFMDWLINPDVLSIAN